jgi:hypothetical protein
MTKPDFSDFYKFLASLGIILISLSFVIPWLFLHETFDISIKVDEISQLTSDAQALIGIRQRYALMILQNIGWISIVIGVVGLVLFLTGIALWWSKKQTILDEKENLELLKLRYDVEKLIPKLTAEEISENVLIETSDNSEGITPQENKNYNLLSIIQYFEIEKAVINKLQECFGEKSILTNRKIGKSNIDAILLARGPRRRDVIIEIKTATVISLDLKKVVSIAKTTSRNLEAYVVEIGRKSVGLGILVINSFDGNYDSEIIQRYKQLAKNESEFEDIVIKVLTLQELENITRLQLLQMIDFDIDITDEL